MTTVDTRLTRLNLEQLMTERTEFVLEQRVAEITRRADELEGRETEVDPEYYTDRVADYDLAIQQVIDERAEKALQEASMFRHPETTPVTGKYMKERNYSVMELRGEIRMLGNALEDVDMQETYRVPQREIIFLNISLLEEHLKHLILAAKEYYGEDVTHEEIDTFRRY